MLEQSRLVKKTQETRSCSRCCFTGEITTNFPRFKTPKGETRYRSYCKSCDKKRKDAWRSAHKIEHNIRCRNWVRDNSAKRKETSKKWREKNPEYSKQYKQNYDKNKINAHTSVRRKRVQQATPTWLTKKQRKEMLTIYETCGKLRKAGVDVHVDHIVPLQGKDVCGLHVPWNLEILGAKENMSKSNSFSCVDERSET